MLAEVVDSTLCFLWQDNNAVLGVTTAHRIKDETIERLQKRPSPSSANAAIVQPVFGDEPFKWLHIPRVIDDYNHYMNGVDRANQLRKNIQFIDHMSIEFGVLWVITSLISLRSTLICSGKETEWIQANEVNDPIEKLL